MLTVVVALCLALLFSIKDVKIIKLLLQREDSSVVALHLDVLIAQLCF